MTLHSKLFRIVFAGLACTLCLPAFAATTAPAALSTWFTLGMGHILGGFDHLLFLGALLLGQRRLKPMLGIVTTFTLAHSLTLALAALNLVQAPAAVVEPLIAASIIAACLAALLGREAGREHYWMAGVFGLVHGFGFAGPVRDAALAQPATDIVLPLLSFNLGVEAGQLMAAALLVPLLMLARRQPQFVRHGLPALCVTLMLVSGYWLAQRLALSV